MTIPGNSYSVKQIDAAVDRVRAALVLFPEGHINAGTVQLLLELYLGALDADKPQPKSAAGD